MNDDEIDRLLSGAGQQWRTEYGDAASTSQAPMGLGASGGPDYGASGLPIEVALSRLPAFHQRQRTRHWVLLSLLAMIAVVAMAVIALQLIDAASGRGDGPPARPPLSTPGPDPGPWIRVGSAAPRFCAAPPRQCLREAVEPCAICPARWNRATRRP